MLQLQLEEAKGHVGDALERQARDALLADEGFAVQVDRDPFTLQHEHHFGERSTAVGDEIDRPRQRQRQGRRVHRCKADDRPHRVAAEF